MTIFSDIVLDDTVIQDNADKVRTQTPYALDAAVYDATIEEAYSKDSQSSKAKALHLRIKVGNKFIDQDFWVTSKTGDTYTIDKDGNKKPLRGFEPVNNLAVLLTGKPMNQLAFAPAMIPDRSYGANDGAMKTVDAVTDFINKPIKVAISNTKELKRAPDANGKWVDTDEVKVVNQMEVFFDSATSKTKQELVSRQPATFMAKWEEACTGQVIDRTKRRKQ